MTKHTYKGWTQADDAELVLMREAWVSTKEIARALNRTPSSVSNRISVLKLPVGGRLDSRQVEWAKASINIRADRLFGHLPETVEIYTPTTTGIGGSQSKASWWASMMWWRK